MEKKRKIGEILRTLCEWKKAKIIEAEACPVEIPFKAAAASFIRYLKRKSRLTIYEKFLELRYKYRNREFRCRGYYVDTAGKNENKIAGHVQHQLEEIRRENNCNGKFLSPFTSGK